MAEKTSERYARADVRGGYIYNKFEIDYFKQAQQVDVIDNLMLGDFNKKGAYIMEKGIVDELVKLRKIYQYSFGSTTFCKSAVDVGGYGYIEFAIKMRSNKQDGTISANLQILETIDRANGYYQNTNSAVIATYIAKESNTFVVDMLKYFNVVSKKEDGLLKTEHKEEDVDLIIARKKFETLLKKGAMDKIDEQHEVLFKKRKKLLEKSAIGKKILEDFDKEMYKVNGWFVKEGIPGYYRYLNQILDGLVDVRAEEVLKDTILKAGLNKANEQFALSVSAMLAKTSEVIVLATKDSSMMELEKLAKQAQQDSTEQFKQQAMSTENKTQPQAEQAKPKVEAPTKSENIAKTSSHESADAVLKPNKSVAEEAPKAPGLNKFDSLTREVFMTNNASKTKDEEESRAAY